MSNDDTPTPETEENPEAEELMEDLGEDVDADLDLDLEDADEAEEDTEEEAKPKAKAKVKPKAKAKPKPKKEEKPPSKGRAPKKRGTTIETIMDASRLNDDEDAAKCWTLINRDATDMTKKTKYTLKATYTSYEMISHKLFGVGFVRQVLSPTKIEVIFEDGFKRLVCNR